MAEEPLEEIVARNEAIEDHILADPDQPEDVKEMIRAIKRQREIFRQFAPKKH